MHPVAYLRIAVYRRPPDCLTIEERDTSGECPFEISDCPEHKYGHHQKKQYNQLQYVHHGVEVLHEACYDRNQDLQGDLKIP